MDTIAFIFENYPVYGVILAFICASAVYWTVSAVASAIRIWSK